jgi:hypothetical protein
VLDEFPRRPEQAQEILDVVAAWLDESGHPEVTVQFNWHLKKSRKGQSRAAKPVLYWKMEDGPEDAGPEGSPHDVGPAWLQTQAAAGDVTQEPVNDGEWISRSQALNLASANGYTLNLDD